MKRKIIRYLISAIVAFLLTYLFIEEKDFTRTVKTSFIIVVTIIVLDLIKHFTSKKNEKTED